MFYCFFEGQIHGMTADSWVFNGRRPDKNSLRSKRPERVLKLLNVLKTSPAFLLALFILLATGCSEQKQPSEKNYVSDSIPTRDEVGALSMPEEIAPVNAPFETAEFNKPDFPDLTVSIKDYGAEEGVFVKNEIQEAIDDVHQKGGGTVIVPEGAWHSGRVELKSNVNFHLAEGAELHFSGKVKDYLPAVFTRNSGIEVMSLGAFIYAHKQENIAITGKGKLVGPPEDSEVRNRIMSHANIENVVNLDAPVSERVYTGQDEEWILAPMFISPTDCKDVYIEGITLEKGAFWNIVPVYCNGVIIRGVTVNSVGIERGDGIDVESSENVLIEYSTLNTGDDCFAMKAGRNEDGLRVDKPTQNVVVRHCLAKKGHGGITCGSETAGMIRNLYVHDCVFDSTCVGIRFKTRRSRGGGGENLYYERIRMDLACTMIKWDMLGKPMYVGDLAYRLPERAINKGTPAYKNIHISDFIAERGTHFLKVYGIPETPLSQVTIKNGKVNSEALIRVHDAQDLTLKNINITSQDSLIELLGVRNLTFENMNFNVPGNALVTDIQGIETDSILFKNSMPEKPKDWKSNLWHQN